MEIKVLGPGCPKCEHTAKLIGEAVDEEGVDARIEEGDRCHGDRRIWRLRNTGSCY